MNPLLALVLAGAAGAALAHSQRRSNPAWFGAASGRHFDYGPTKSDSYEGRMAKQALRNIAKRASELEAALEDNDDLPGWVNSKIATADDRLDAAARYMMYEIERYNGR